jgi:hypothetical protein
MTSRGIAHAQEWADRHPLRAERRHIGLKFVDHEGIRPPQELLSMSTSELGGQTCRLHGWIIIDAQDMEWLRSALRQGRGHVTGGQGMGTVALPVLERRG